MTTSARALHYVLKIGDRAKNMHFFQNILGMKVLRHEEFKEGCDAQCNGPYDNRWSKTMIGYGEEKNSFVLELTYNYGVQSYELGNDLGGITIRCNEIVNRANEHKYPVEGGDGSSRFQLTAPDGYKFFIQNESSADGVDPVQEVTLHCSDLQQSMEYWRDTLGMQVVEEEKDQFVRLTYNNTFFLKLSKLDVPMNRAKAYGRIAFAVPWDDQPKIEEAVNKVKGKILTPLIKLDTPGKATVRVIILADPDGHEICFVDEEGFSQLSAFDPKSDEDLQRYLKLDPFQK